MDRAGIAYAQRQVNGVAPAAFPEVRLADTTAIGWRYVRAGDLRPQPPPFPRDI